jgi:hypothetical protein
MILLLSIPALNCFDADNYNQPRRAVECRHQDH